MLYEELKSIADANYDRLLSNKMAFPGVNGPYRYTDETPVRNTAHWLITYSYLWKSTHEMKYKRICDMFLEYLCNEQKKSKNGAIECMYGKHFDHLNGLIGQAWVIEALVYAFKTFNEHTYYDVAKAIFRSQLFDEEVNLWKRVELDGTTVDYDYTANHQVWYAVAGLMLLDCEYDKDVEKDVSLFLEAIKNLHFDVYSDGLIKHYVKLERPLIHSKKYYIKQNIKNCLVPLRRINPNKYDKKAQEIGYHIFELYGYALVALYRPQYGLFASEEFRKAVKYALDVEKVHKKLNIDKVLDKPTGANEKMNMYAYGYNSPAFELPFICAVFGDGKCIDPDMLFDIQKGLTYSEETAMFDRNNYDCETLTARLYEVVRYLEYVKE